MGFEGPDIRVALAPTGCLGRTGGTVLHASESTSNSSGLSRNTDNTSLIHETEGVAPQLIYPWSSVI